VIGRRTARAVGVLSGAALLAATLTACGHQDPPWAHLSWQGAALPVPDGSRAVVRSATWCADRWVVVGATADAAGDTRAAAWSSPDGRTWGTVRLDPHHDYYAAHEILSTVACSRGRLAMLGAKPGGAHGSARTANWRQRPDGSLAAVVHASYLLFGGTRAVAVNRLEGGPHGFMIAGTRASGAAVWTSPTGASFRLHEGVPGLANSSSARTQGTDAVPAGRGWLVVGLSTEDDGRLDATVWTPAGTDRWLRRVLPGGDTVSTADRVIHAGSGPVVAGLLDQEFGLWRRQGVNWTLEGTFGERVADATSASYVSGLAWTGSLVVATYSDGTRFRLAIGGTSPAPSTLPTSVDVSGDHAVTVATHGADALLLTDDGRQGRVWLAHVPAPTS
jgi:hypothetical protein